MNWCPRYSEKPFRLLFDSEVWLVSLAIMILIGIFGVNQAVSVVVLMACGFVLQKIVDKNKKGYILHLFCKLGLLRFFPFGKYRI